MSVERWVPRAAVPAALLLVVGVAVIALLASSAAALGSSSARASSFGAAWAPSGQPAVGVSPTLSVTGASPSAVSLGWTATADPTFADYEVQESTSSSSTSWSTVGTLSSQSSTSYYVSGLSAGTTYGWQVVEVDSLGVSVASNAVQYDQPAVATLSASTLSSSSVQLSWVNHASYGGHVRFVSYTIWQFGGGASATSIGTITSAATTSAQAAGLTNGTAYTFQVETTDGCSGASNCGSTTPSASTYSNSVSATPAPVPVTKYSATFSESGLPTSTTWSVTLNGSSQSATGSAIGFSVANGSYAFTVRAVTGYTSKPSSGSVTVAGRAVTQAVAFQSAAAGSYSVTFSESGLATGTTWAVSLAGTNQSSSGSTDVFTESNGSYSFSVGAPSGYSASPSTGTVTVAGGPASSAVTFTYSSGPSSASISHVVLILLENEEVTNLWAGAPYEQYLASAYGNATAFYATCHDSSADYFAVTSGRTLGCGKAYPNPGYQVSEIGDLFEQHNLTWTAYQESMPSACDLSSSGEYINYHDPFVYYRDLNQNLTRCDAHVISTSSFNQSVASGDLPTFSFYTPNSKHDGHGPTNSPWSPTTGLGYIESWLRGFLPPILNHTGAFDTASERSLVNHTAFILLYDEGTTNQGYTTGSVYTSGCYNQTGRDVTACGGHVQVTCISPYSLHREYTQDATTYSVQSTIEWLFGLPSDGGWDGTSSFPPMKSLFSFTSNGYPAAPSRLGTPTAPGVGIPGNSGAVSPPPMTSQVAPAGWWAGSVAAGVGVLGILALMAVRGRRRRAGRHDGAAGSRPPMTWPRLPSDPPTR